MGSIDKITPIHTVQLLPCSISPAVHLQQSRDLYILFFFYLYTFNFSIPLGLLKNPPKRGNGFTLFQIPPYYILSRLCGPI